MAAERRRRRRRKRNRVKRTRARPSKLNLDQLDDWRNLCDDAVEDLSDLGTLSDLTTKNLTRMKMLAGNAAALWRELYEE